MNVPRARWRLSLIRTLLRGLVLVLAACGGGSDQAPDSQLLPDTSELDGAPCPDCRPGHLSGVVATGGPLADAEVRVIAADGRQLVGRSDANGRYDIVVEGLPGPLLLQVTGVASGRPLRLHSACRGAEIGTRAVNVTPLTELIVAQALGGRPAELLREGRVDNFRLDAATLRLAEMSVERLVRPLLDLAQVPPQVDLRVTPFAANGSGIDRVLDWLLLEPDAGGYALRHLAMADAEAAVWVPGALASQAVLPLDATMSTQLRAASAALPGIETELAALTALFVASPPDALALQAHLSADFRDGGLSANEFIAAVAQRRDAADLGGFSWQGARWHEPRITATGDGGALRVRARVSLPGTLGSHDEEMWWEPSGSGWKLRGDGRAARVAVRNLAVLGPRPLDEAAVRAQPGAVCPALFEILPSTSIDQRCRIEGGTAGLPASGVLDLGAPGDALFGTLGLFRSAAEQPMARLAEQRAHSRLLATPSRQVTRYVVFELDARRVHADARQARVTGPGLPAAGLLLEPPLRVAGAPVSDFWQAGADADGDWQAVAHGNCEAAADDAEATACRQAWTGLQAGARYRFVLLDAAGAELGSVESRLPDTPASEAQLVSRSAELLAQFALAQAPAQQPTLARVLAAPESDNAAGESLWVQLPWTAPIDTRQRLLHVQLDWWRGAVDDPGATEWVRRQRYPASAGVLEEQVAPRPGFRSMWLAARATAEDALGNRYTHFVSPQNPY